MRVNPEEAVRSVIAFKQQSRKQLVYEQKLMFERVKNRKSIDSKMLEKIGNINGVKLNKKTLPEIKAISVDIFKKSLKEFRKIKRPAPAKKEGILSTYAHHHNKPGGGHGGTPAPQPEPVVNPALCFSSAIRCEGNSCDRDTSMIFPVFRSSGEGGLLGQGPSYVPVKLFNY